ncbi:MAG: HAMP domain-containing sensor histidine kinase [Desulfobacterales bacterium]|nr:HAMP domain-containing sensor histidine kinase [Desulfobacterales bacterium]
MFKSLYSKLAVVLLVLFALVGLSLVAVTLFSAEMYQQEVDQKLNRELAAHIVSEKLLLQDNQINENALKEIFHMLMVINPSIEIYLLDPDGGILAFSAPPGKVKRKRVSLEPIKTWMDGSANYPILGDDPRSLLKQKAFSVARIPARGQLEGYLYVILGGETYESVVHKLKGSYILRLSAWAISASLLVALAAGLLLFALLTGRLRRLNAAIDAFRNGTALSEISLPGTKQSNTGDEIQQLSFTFKEMARRIESQMEKIKKSDTLRRELVANVSHDLRTPLATLQGYIETLLLKADHLTHSERKNYLEIAIKHCERLSQLVEELFELARLDSQETKPHCEPFNIRELVQDVIQKFQLKAEKKKLTITTDIGNEMPFVVADIKLIERVLENLIENALRHTPPGGEISVVLMPDRQEIVVEVSDTGSGISQQELPYIFERFYQLDKSRNSSPGMAGLGLAICKRVLELHGRSIGVSSNLGSGTTFTFNLPVKATA